MYRVRCFGRLAIEDADGDGRTLRSQKHLALLTYLLGHRERNLPRKRLASLFWDTEPRLARHSLSQALYDIRSELPDVTLERSTTHVGIGRNSVTFDAEEFESAVRENDLKRAVSLYEGEFAPDLEDAGNSDFERWLESERGRFRRLAEMALYRHVRACDDRARWGEMCVSAVRLLNMNPLNEEAHRALMRGLWLQGDQLSAVRHFEEVKGFLEDELPDGVSEETRELLQRIRSSRPSGNAPTVHERARPDMVGREREFEVLKRELEEAREGSGRLVRVWGEAGLGKTRLLEEFRELTALESVRLLTSRCYAAESDVPYGPVVDGLSEVAAELSDGGDVGQTYYQLGHLFPEAFSRPENGGDSFAEPDAGRRRLYEETADLLRRVCDEKPVVWLVEDVHWIDASSGSLLHYLSRRLSQHAFLLVVTARSHEEPDEASRALLEEEVPGVDVREVRLQPLDPDEVGELAEFGRDEPLEDATVEKIHKLAGGNPFYAQEILRSSSHLRDEKAMNALANPSKRLISENLRVLLNRRLRGLSAKAVRILETVATAGRHATPAVVSDAAGLAREEITELAGTLYSRGLLRDVDDRLDFFHDITREFIYGNMGQLQRAALHLTVGEVLASQVDRVGAAALARHFQKGGDDARAYEYALRAAREAEERHAHEEAIQMASLALEVAEGEEERVEALEVLANAETALGYLTEAKAHWEELLAHSADTKQSVTYQLQLAHCLIELGHWQQAETQLRDLAGDLKPIATDLAGEQSHLLHLQAKLAVFGNREALLTQTISEVYRLYNERQSLPGPASARALNLCSLGAHALYTNSSEDAYNYLQETKAILDELPVSLKIRCILLNGIAAYRLARLDTAQAEFEKALSLSHEYRDIINRVNALNNLSGCHLNQGRWQLLDKYYKEAKSLTALIPEDAYACVVPDVNYANALLYQHSYNSALEVVKSLLNRLEAEVEWSWLVAELYATRGLSLLPLGRSEEARDCWAVLREYDSWTGVQNRENLAWLDAYCRFPDNLGSAAQHLRSMADKELPMDRVSGLRMQVIADLFSSQSEKEALDVSQGLSQKLRSVNNSWFVHFSRRWMGQVLGTAIV